MTDVRELLPLHALGVLDADEAAAVDKAVAADPALAAELAAYRDAAANIAPAAVPPPEIKERLLASVGGGRFETFAARFAELFDVTVERARDLLHLIDRPPMWEQPMPGIGLIHFAGGPACAAADCGFIRVAPGCTFPWHAHRGEEVSIVLTGTLRDHTGRLFHPGDELVQATGTQHDITAEGDADVIFAARAFNGIEVRQ